MAAFVGDVGDNGIVGRPREKMVAVQSVPRACQCKRRHALQMENLRVELVVGDWWFVVGGWRLAVGGWWLVVAGCRLVVGG